MITVKRFSGTILAVDDTPSNVELLEAWLTPEGYRVKTATSGAEALEKIKAEHPDLVLLDVMMPGMDGLAVCRKIREDKKLPYIPVIFITASELELKDVVKGLDSGGDDYIRKPFEPTELFSRIQSTLRIKRLYDDLAKTKAELSRYVSLSTLKMVENKIKGHEEPMNYDAYVTVLFSDIRGFTQISEGMDSKDLFDQLNTTIGKQLKVIEKYEGIIDKLSGDEVMAVFEGPRMGENAIGCALELAYEELLRQC